MSNIRATLSARIHEIWGRRKVSTVPSEMRPSERATYEAWQKIARATVSMDDLRKHIVSEIGRLRDLREGEAKPDNDDAIRDRLLMWKSLLAIVDRPEAAMHQLDDHIKHLLLIESKN